MAADGQNPSEVALVDGVGSALLAGVEGPGLSLEQRRTGTQSPHHLEIVVANGEVWGPANILAKDVGLLETVGETRPARRS